MESLRGSGADRGVLTVIGVSLVPRSSKTSAGDINAESDVVGGGSGVCGGVSDGDRASGGRVTLRGGRGDGGNHIPG